MKLRHTLAFLTLFTLAIVQPGLAQPDSAQLGLGQPDSSTISSSALLEDGNVEERASTANDQDLSIDFISLSEGSLFAAAFTANASSGDSFCGICEQLRDLCLAEGIFTPRQCVQQYRACVEDLC